MEVAVFHIARSYAWLIGVFAFAFVSVVGVAIIFPVGTAQSGDLFEKLLGGDDHAALSAKLDALQGSVDALFPSLTIFPGDGVNGPGLAYRDNGDGTITDMNTGLMWETKVVGGNISNCFEVLHGVNTRCTWDEASGAWIDDVNFELYAGYDDWRLANIRELMSILDYGTSLPAIDPIFGPTASSSYWTLTSSAPFPVRAWVMFFNSGAIGTGLKATDLARVRAVRGGR